MIDFDPESGRGVSRDVLKAVAMFTMFLNHFAHIFVPDGIWHDVLIYTGYFTLPMMCFFLADGFQHTRNRLGYVLRLAFTGALSQVFYMGVLRETNLNVMFTLAACGLVLWLYDVDWPVVIRIGLGCLIYVFIFMSDWGFSAPVFACLFYNGVKTGRRWRVFVSGIACYVFYVFTIGPYGFDITDTVTALVSGLGILAASFAGAFLYNGRRASVPARAAKALQGFFYLFYPAHLALLWLAAMIFQA